MYLNARIPELTSIQVSSPEELEDYEDIVDEFTGEVIYRWVHTYLYIHSMCIYIIRMPNLKNLSFSSLCREDKRSPDFNGDRETMEYQGLDPDARGPFVFSSGGGSMIRPA